MRLIQPPETLGDPPQPIPPTGEREELPPWLVDGILEMEAVIKAY